MTEAHIETSMLMETALLLDIVKVIRETSSQQ